MKNVIPIYKPLGLTPLEAINKFKESFPEYLGQKISYAGRLDPMAEGLLLLLVGEENKKRNEYEKLQKTYEFTILLGIETDTYDMLGIIEKSKNDARMSKQALIVSDFDSPRSSSGEAGIRISNLLSSFIGKKIQPYPPYSSKAVKGKPLYWWARENRLNEIDLPSKEIEVYDLQLKSTEEIKIQDLRFRIQDNINKVSGNFRQIEILHSWENFFKQTTVKSFTLLRCFATCSSGTYIRGIAYEIGQKIGRGAITLSIKRTNVGEYDISSIINI